MGEPFPKQALVFTRLQYKSFENTLGKEEIARNEQFLLFPQCFLSFQRTFCHFHQICHPQTLSVWKSLKFIVWERAIICICQKQFTIKILANLNDNRLGQTLCAFLVLFLHSKTANIFSFAYIIESFSHDIVVGHMSGKVSYCNIMFTTCDWKMMN